MPSSKGPTDNRRAAARDPLSPQWEDCKVCGGDHWTKDHSEHPFNQQRFDAETRQLKAGIRKRGEESEPYHTEAYGPSPDTRAEAVPVAESHKPGEAHRYRIECEVCGERGTVRLSVEPQVVE